MYVHVRLQVLPRLFAVTSDPGIPQDVRERACYALDTFCESLEPQHITRFLPQLVQQLLGVLSSAQAHGHAAGSSGGSMGGGRAADVQEVALSALASCVHAARRAFAPYVAALMPALHHFLQASRVMI